MEPIADGLSPKKSLTITAVSDDGTGKQFQAICRIDTPVELDYYRNGGILQYVLRNLAQT